MDLFINIKDFISKACASHYEKPQIGIRQNPFIYPKKFNWEIKLDTIQGNEAFVGMLSVDLLLELLMDAVRLEVPTTNTSFMPWAIFIIRVYSGSYLDVAAGESMICRGENMRCQRLIGLSEKDYSNMTCRLNASSTWAEGNYIVSRGLCKTSQRLLLTLLDK